MGIKNIHIVLIAASIFICLIFGIWSVNNAHGLWGMVSFAAAIGLTVYGVGFVKKAKTL